MSPNGNPPVRVAVYLRQSLDASGEQLAVQRQRDACLRIVRERGWTVVDEYVDNSISASDKRRARPAYDRLIADFEAGAFGALVCYDLDRLTRQPRQLEDWIDRAEGRGLRMVTANGEADLTTDGGRMYARIKAAVARGEIERKAARQRAAAAQRAERGRPPLGPRLTGYLSDGTIVEDEAKTVKVIFERFDAEDSLRSIAASLTADGVPTRRAARWSPSSVSDILRNPRYAGRAVYDGAQTGRAGNWDAIVDGALFDRVQERLSDPRRLTHHHGYDRRYLGSGVYLCGVCDRAVNSHTGRRYRCPDGHLTRMAEPIDAVVDGLVRARLGQRELASLLPVADSPQRRELAAEVTRLSDRVIQIEADYDDDLIDGRRYRVATDKANAELAAARSRLAALGGGMGAAAHVLRAADPAAAYDASPLMIQRAVVEVLLRIRLMRVPQGRRGFDPESVGVEWKVGAA